MEKPEIRICLDRARFAAARLEKPQVYNFSVVSYCVLMPIWHTLALTWSWFHNGPRKDGGKQSLNIIIPSILGTRPYTAYPKTYKP